MARFMENLASVILTAALTPLAANAMTATPLNPMQIQVQKAISSAVHSDAAAAQGRRSRPSCGVDQTTRSILVCFPLIAPIVSLKYKTA
jgi:hypothetical protein